MPEENKNLEIQKKKLGSRLFRGRLILLFLATFSTGLGWFFFQVEWVVVAVLLFVAILFWKTIILEIQKRGEIKISKKGWIGSGIIIISMLALNGFASTPPYEDEEQAIIFILSLLLFLVLLIGITLFFLGSKGYKRKLILIFIILPFLLRINSGIGGFNYIISYIPSGNQIERINKEALDTKNAEKCFDIGKFPFFISYFLTPPLVEMESIEPSRAKCVTNIAVVTKNASFCESLSIHNFIIIGNNLDHRINRYKASCLLESSPISEKYSDLLKKCEELSDSYEKGKCIEYFAIKSGNTELCDVHVFTDECRAAIVFSNMIPNNDPAKCKETAEEGRKTYIYMHMDEDTCLRSLAIKEDDIGICKLMKSGVNMSQCEDEIEKFGQQVLPKEEKGEIVYLGIRYRIINEEIQEENNLPVDYGAWIIRGDSPGETAISPGSSAEKANLKEGDIILEFNNEKITPQNYLAKILTEYSPGDKVILKILREAEEKDIEVILEGKSK